jgi:4'-phosphopantetheinyl transferase
VSSSWTAGPEDPPGPTGEVHVWRVDLEPPTPPAAELLPEAERRRAERKLDPLAATRWTASRWALRSLLSRYLNEAPGTIALAEGSHGKPVLADAPERLAFNLSHSGGLALAAFTVGRQVGVDVEAIDPDRDVLALAARALDPEAAAAVRATAPASRTAAFHEAWARHEARLKCAGGGLGEPAPAGDPIEVSLLDVGPGYAAALAVAGAEPLPVRRYSFGWA